MNAPPDKSIILNAPEGSLEHPTLVYIGQGVKAGSVCFYFKVGDKTNIVYGNYRSSTELSPGVYRVLVTCSKCKFHC